MPQVWLRALPAGDLVGEDYLGARTRAAATASLRRPQGARPWRWSAGAARGAQGTSTMRIGRRPRAAACPAAGASSCTARSWRARRRRQGSRQRPTCPHATAPTQAARSQLSGAAPAAPACHLLRARAPLASHCRLSQHVCRRLACLQNLHAMPALLQSAGRYQDSLQSCARVGTTVRGPT